MRVRLSVGQSIVAFGSLAEPATATSPATFDATNGRVRMLPTHLHGTVNSVVPGQLNLACAASIGSVSTCSTLPAPASPRRRTRIRRTTRSRPARSGSRTSSPAKSVQVVGFARPFGNAPADFEGRTVVDYREPPALLGIGWGTVGHDGAVLEHERERARARPPQREHRRAPCVARRCAPHRSLGLARFADARAADDGRALYGISVGRDIRLFATLRRIQRRSSRCTLAGGRLALALTASGSYDAANATLHATPHRGALRRPTEARVRVV